jgi:hypothetical protein
VKLLALLIQGEATDIPWVQNEASGLFGPKERGFRYYFDSGLILKEFLALKIEASDISSTQD